MRMTRLSTMPTCASAQARTSGGSAANNGLWKAGPAWARLVQRMTSSDLSGRSACPRTRPDASCCATVAKSPGKNGHGHQVGGRDGGSDLRRLCRRKGFESVDDAVLSRLTVRVHDRVVPAFPQACDEVHGLIHKDQVVPCLGEQVAHKASTDPPCSPDHDGLRHFCSFPASVSPPPSPIDGFPRNGTLPTRSAGRPASPRASPSGVCP